MVCGGCGSGRGPGGGGVLGGEHAGGHGQVEHAGELVVDNHHKYNYDYNTNGWT